MSDVTNILVLRHGHQPETASRSCHLLHPSHVFAETPDALPSALQVLVEKIVPFLLWGIAEARDTRPDQTSTCRCIDPVDCSYWFCSACDHIPSNDNTATHWSSPCLPSPDDTTPAPSSSPMSRTAADCPVLINDNGKQARFMASPHGLAIRHRYVDMRRLR